MVKISRREATWVVTEQEEVLGIYLTFREAFEAFDKIKQTLDEHDKSYWKDYQLRGLDYTLPIL